MNAEEPLDHWLDDPKYRKTLLDIVEIYNPETKEVCYGRFCSGCFRWISMGTKKSNADNSRGRKCLQCSNADKKDKPIEYRTKTIEQKLSILKGVIRVEFISNGPITNLKYIR
jgi:hypothetical protein